MIGFRHGILIKLLSSEMSLKELYISIATRTESYNIMAFTLPSQKYSQGSKKVIRQLPALNGHTVKFVNAEHLPQFEVVIVQQACGNQSQD